MTFAGERRRRGSPPPARAVAVADHDRLDVGLAQRGDDHLRADPGAVAHRHGDQHVSASTIRTRLSGPPKLPGRIGRGGRRARHWTAPWWIWAIGSSVADPERVEHAARRLAAVSTRSTGGAAATNAASRGPRCARPRTAVTAAVRSAVGVPARAPRRPSRPASSSCSPAHPSRPGPSAAGRALGGGSGFAPSVRPSAAASPAEPTRVAVAARRRRSCRGPRRSRRRRARPAGAGLPPST